MTDTPEPEVLTVSEVATLLRMGIRQCREAIYRGDIQGCHRIGTQYRCSAVALRRQLHGDEPNGTPALVTLTPEERARQAGAITAAVVAAIDAFIAETEAGRRFVRPGSADID